MEIKDRNIDSVAVKKFDEMAKKNEISRQEYLKSVLEKIAYENEISEREMHLEWLISKNIIVMELMSKRVNQLENLLIDLMEE